MSSKIKGYYIWDYNDSDYFSTIDGSCEDKNNPAQLFTDLISAKVAVTNYVKKDSAENDIDPTDYNFEVYAVKGSELVYVEDWNFEPTGIKLVASKNK